MYFFRVGVVKGGMSSDAAFAAPHISCRASLSHTDPEEAARPPGHTAHSVAANSSDTNIHSLFNCPLS
ncbi:hypothetical protein LDENG_00035540 [Lucifuga dentata]|nr:hypothetical protein LDENG_00035540 [Lucifuga dentata]